MTQPTPCLRACRFCLSTDAEGGALRLVTSPPHILDLLVGKELDLAELWLCYRCSHTVRKICLFRDLCSRAHAILQEYSIIQDSDVARNYFLGEKETFSQGRELELSMSNTLCMSIMIERLESPIQIESFNKNGKLPKNYTENISTHHVSESLKIEPGVNSDPNKYLGNIDKHEMCWSVSLSSEMDPTCNNYEKDECFDEKFGMSQFFGNVSDATDLSIESLSKMEYQSTDINRESGQTIYHIPLHDSVSHPPNLEQPNKKCLSKKAFPLKSLDNKKKDRRSISSDKNRTKSKLPKNIAKVIHKVYSAPLSLEEQMNEKEDRSREESYLRAAYKCDLCVVTFQSQLALVNHNKRHLESRGPLICPICSLRFPKYENLKNHRESHSIRFICHVCEKRFYNRKTFISHLIWHSGEFKCPGCGEAFSDKKQMKEHMKKDHPVKAFECEICGKVSSSKSLHLVHMQRHRGIPTHVCSVCSKGFYSQQNLYLHLETHNEKKPLHYCVECDRYFKTLNILNSHLMYAAAHRDIAILKFKCAECPMAFHNEQYLSQHMAARHGGLHKYVCDECGAKYAVRHGLVRHIKFVHQGYQLPRKFPCTVCEKAFTTKTMLVSHIRIHTGERPFKCPQCSDTFKQKSAMGTHIKLVHLKLKRNVRRKKKGE